MPRLYILSGPDLGKTLDFEEGASIGRASECEIHLRDASVSRQHARLERDEEGWRVIDTGSRNGVVLRGERVENARLADGDEFRIGEVTLRIRLEPAPQTRNLPQAAAPPRPAAEVEEIRLEEEEPIRPAPPSPSLGSTVLAAKRPAAVESRGAKILQYHRIPDREGFFASDLAQQPLWIKLGAGLIAIAVFAAIFLFAFKGTSMLKGRAAGGAGEVPEERGP